MENAAGAAALPRFRQFSLIAVSSIYNCRMASSLVTCQWLKEQLDKGTPGIRVIDGM